MTGNIILLIIFSENNGVSDCCHVILVIKDIFGVPLLSLCRRSFSDCGQRENTRKFMNQEMQQKCEDKRYEFLAFSTMSPFLVLFLRRHLIPQALHREPLPKVGVRTEYSSQRVIEGE